MSGQWNIGNRGRKLALRKKQLNQQISAYAMQQIRAHISKHLYLKYSAPVGNISIKEPISVEAMKNKSYDELHEMFKGDILPKSANAGTAATSQFFCTQKFFVKHTIRNSSNHVYEREKYIASILKEFCWYPELLYSNDINKILIFKNVGVPVTRENKPNDLETQFNQILNDMKSKNIQHNDIKIGEILMDNKKKIYLCDFGWSSINNNLNCGIDMWGCNNKNKPGGWYNDDTTLTRLGLI